MAGVKIAIIGAGSVGFTRKLVTDMLCVPELQDVDIALTDIDERNLGMVRDILETDCRPSTGCRRASSPRPTGGGRSKARDTSSIARASAGSRPLPTISASRCNTASINASATRSAPAASCTASARSRRFSISARTSARFASRSAKLLNYANPMAMNTWAAIDHGKVETIGLCHGVQHGWRQIADALGADDPREVEYVCSRHQSSDLVHRRPPPRPQHRPRRAGRRFRAPSRLFAAGKGSDRRPQALRLLFDREQRPPLRISALVSQAARRDQPMDRHVGMDPRRDRRLSALLPETRNWFETDFPPFWRRPGSRSTPRARTDEHASHIIEALETGRPYRGHFNVKNDGLITNLAARRDRRDRPASSIASGSTWPPASPCRWPAPRPARPRSTCSACPSRRP